MVEAIRAGECRGYVIEDGRVAGFGDDGFVVRAIPRAMATDIIRRRHYSGTVVNNSYVHLGILWGGELLGAMQWGYAMNPASGRRIVPGTGNREYLELNRMWLDDRLGRNAESLAISYAVKFIRRALPQVAWLQSFADERCGRWGVVYQAANFLFIGSHRSRFYRLDGEWYHEISMSRVGSPGDRGRRLRSNRDRAEAFTFRQFRYFFPLAKSARRRLAWPVLPYPKPLCDPSIGRPAFPAA